MIAINITIYLSRNHNDTSVKKLVVTHFKMKLPKRDPLTNHISVNI